MASFGSIGAVQHKANSTGDGAEYTREAVNFLKIFTKGNTAAT